MKRALVVAALTLASFAWAQDAADAGTEVAPTFEQVYATDGYEQSVSNLARAGFDPAEIALLDRSDPAPTGRTWLRPASATRPPDRRGRRPVTSTPRHPNTRSAAPPR